MHKIGDSLKRVREAYLPDADDLVYLLKLKTADELEALFTFASMVRKDHLGEGVFLRGIIEFSNFCRNRCRYCGLNSNNRDLLRYRMTAREILQSVERIVSCGISTVVLQSGESDELDAHWLKDIIIEIKNRFDMAVTLSLGECAYKDYKLWRDAGADRYLLKIETSEKALYKSLHPGASFENRLRCLKDLRCLGFEVGSGNIVGLKGQTIHSLAQDIIFFKKENLDMIGIGPFIPHPKTELREEITGEPAMVLKVIALTRIITANTNIPATTALAGGKKDFRIEGLRAGANVLMPHFTPRRFRNLYELYPQTSFLSDVTGSCLDYVEEMARIANRFIDYAKGGRKYAEYAA